MVSVMVSDQRSWQRAGPSLRGLRKFSSFKLLADGRVPFIRTVKTPVPAAGRNQIGWSLLAKPDAREFLAALV
jgi:hypothetical protein